MGTFIWISRSTQDKLYQPCSSFVFLPHVWLTKYDMIILFTYGFLLSPTCLQIIEGGKFPWDVVVVLDGVVDVVDVVVVVVDVVVDVVVEVVVVDRVVVVGRVVP